MTDFGKRRFIIFLTLFLVMVTAAAFLFWREGQYCLGVEILSQKQADRYSQYRHQDCSDILTFQNELTAIDLETDTIYISQNIEQESTCRDLIGQLEISNETYKLYFVEDSLFFDMGTAVKEAHPFQLLVTDGTSTFMRYNVVFTSLPLMRIEGSFSHVASGSRDVFSGTMLLWSPKDPETGSYSVKTSNLWWRTRGQATSAFAKKSWKLRLLDANNENNHLSLLGLGADDDWILNSMVLEDTKFREKLFMDMWNEMVSQSPYNLKMSTGEYVDVVVNGKYCGVYLLQRRLDQKYWGLGEEDVIFKSFSPIALTPQLAYQIKYCKIYTPAAFQLIEGFFYGTDYSGLNIDNFMDYNLFLQFFASPDNRGRKNTYIVFQKTDAGYKYSLVPWDTDMSLGIFLNNGWSCVYDDMADLSITRIETDDILALYPQTEAETAARWQQLRETVFSQENIHSYLDAYETLLVNSGAYTRDQQLWGLRYDGVDTPAGVRDFIERRLAFLDEYYSVS